MKRVFPVQVSSGSALLPEWYSHNRQFESKAVALSVKLVD